MLICSMLPYTFVLLEYTTKQTAMDVAKYQREFNEAMDNKNLSALKMLVQQTDEGFIAFQYALGR